MFETLAPEALVGEIDDCRRAESMLIFRRLAAIAALLEHRTGDAEEPDATDPSYALITGFARTSAEVAAVMNLSVATAHHTVGHAEALTTRLPRVADLLAHGHTDWPTVQIILTRTDLVDTDLMPQLDQRLADRLAGWQCWSRRRIIHAVDAAVHAIDPAAAKERRVTADTARHVTVTALPNGMAHLRGALPAPAAAVFDTRLTQLATSVCRHDTRTLNQRRADAVYALAEGRDLTCDCTRPDCPTRDVPPESGEASGGTPAAASGGTPGGTPAGASAGTSGGAPRGGAQFVIHVIATADTLTGASDHPGHLQGYGVIDADQVRDLAHTATVRLLTPPTNTNTDTDTGATRYQPSAALDRWIRCRDLTCRFPGCDRPAWSTDIDHTTPFDHTNPTAGGQTTPANLKCYCRFHHRLKTFHAGPHGWRETQAPDGTVILTSPTGRTYRSTPAGMDLFPDLRPPPCAPPAPQRRNRRRDTAARRARARHTLATLRTTNTEQRRINRARHHEIDARQWRNHVRRTLLVLKGGTPSTSPWCTWANDPPEDPTITADWTPPPEPPHDDDDEPPF